MRYIPTHIHPTHDDSGKFGVAYRAQDGLCRDIVGILNKDLPKRTAEHPSTVTVEKKVYRRSYTGNLSGVTIYVDEERYHEELPKALPEPEKSE